MGKAAFNTARAAAVEPDRRARQRREEAPVVADDHQCGTACIEVALQPFDGGEIEVIGRLVQQQDIGRRRQDARKRCPARFPAGQVRRVFLTGEAEFFQEIASGVGIVARPQASLDIGQRRRKAGKVRLLRQVAHQRAGLNEDRAVIRLDRTRGDLQQRRFAGTVASDQRDALAGRHRQLRPGQKRRAAEGQCDVFELKERRSHYALWCRQRRQDARPGADALVIARQVEFLVRRVHAVIVEREADQQ